ncbi:uncharacterized protein [Euphorbia lathyris]|uniref:uncharacterized protein isoform X2 n=1 Tax=Euphorbia lathyris TaxID=212925 RepID=UPI0033141D7C
MNHFNLQKNAVTSCDETLGLVSICDPKGPVVCPKPRRVGNLANSPIRPIRCYQAEICDSKVGAELLDIILMKEGHGAEQAATQVAASPPYFCGSPPTRASNPLTQDARFGDEKITTLSPLSIPSPSGAISPSSSSSRKGGCVRMKYGLKPAAVRVEGFDCLNRDRRNSSIPAMA